MSGKDTRVDGAGVGPLIVEVRSRPKRLVRAPPVLARRNWDTRENDSGGFDGSGGEDGDLIKDDANGTEREEVREVKRGRM